MMIPDSGLLFWGPPYISGLSRNVISAVDPNCGLCAGWGLKSADDTILREGNAHGDQCYYENKTGVHFIVNRDNVCRLQLSVYVLVTESGNGTIRERTAQSGIYSARVAI